MESEFHTTVEVEFTEQEKSALNRVISQDHTDVSFEKLPDKFTIEQLRELSESVEKAIAWGYCSESEYNDYIAELAQDIDSLVYKFAKQ